MHAMPILTIESAENLLKALEDFLDKSDASFRADYRARRLYPQPARKIPSATDPTIPSALAAAVCGDARGGLARRGNRVLRLAPASRQSHVLMSAINERRDADDSLRPEDHARPGALLLRRRQSSKSPPCCARPARNRKSPSISAAKRRTTPATSSKNLRTAPKRTR